MAAQNGTGYTNFSNIVGANENNQLGNTIQSGVQKDVTGLQNNVNQAQQSFQTQANAANNQSQQGYVNQTIQNIANIANAPANSNAPQGQTAPTSPAPQTAPTPAGSFGASAPQAPATSPSPTTPAAPASTPPSTPSQAPAPAQQPQATQASNANLAGSFGVSQPTSGTQTTTNVAQAGDLSKFAQLLQGNYTGPSTLQNYASMLSQGQNLQNTGANVNSPGGLQSLLQQYVGGNNYNRGEQGLDTAILGQTGAPQLKQVAQETANAANIPQSAEAQAAALAQQTATGNQNFANSVRGQLAAAQNPILQNIQQNLGLVNQANTNYDQAAALVQNYLNGSVTAPAAGTNATTGNTSNAGGGKGPVSSVTQAPAAKPKVNDWYMAAFHPEVYAQEQAAAAAAQAPIDANINQISGALNAAAQNGMISSDQINSITKLLPQFAGKTDQLMKDLANSFSIQNPDQYTLQQGATGQQASALNALEALGGQQKQFGTYGGLNLANAGFNLSDLPGYTAPVVTGGGQAEGPANHGIGYDIINSYYGPAIAAASSLAAPVGAALSSEAQTTGDLLKGNFSGAAQSAITTPSNMINAGTNAVNGNLSSVGNSINNLTGWIPGATALNNATIGAIEAPLTSAADFTTDVNNGLTGTAGALTKGNWNGALQSALGGLEGGLNDVGDVTSNALGGIGNLISNATGGTYFCTEIYKYGFINKTQLKEMSAFFLSCIFKRPNMCLFYATNASKIVNAANKNNFDWSTIKNEAVVDILSLFKAGKIDESHAAYSNVIKSMCLKFQETKSLWNDKYLKTTLLDKVICFPKLLFTQSFKNSLRSKWN